MTFFQNYLLLCKENGLAKQGKEMIKLLNVSSGTIAGWEKGATPSVEYLIILSDRFNVSIDWLLGRSNIRNLDKQSETLLSVFQSLDDEMSKNRIIQVCMNEQDKAKHKEAASAI